MFWVVILTLCCMSCIGWILKSNRTKVYPPLPPGPKGLPIVGNIPSVLNAELHSYFADLSKTYGPLVTLRLGTKIGIVASSPSIAKEILKDHDLTFANHDVPVVGYVANYGGHSTAWTPYGPEWQTFRKVSGREMVGNTNLNTTYYIRKQQVRQTMLYLREQAGSAVKIGDQMFLTMLNVVTSMLWGDTMKCEDRAKLAAEYRALMAEVTNLIGKPNISDFLPGLERFDLQGLVRRMRGVRNRLDGIFEVVIAQRKKLMENGEGGKKDFLQALMDMVTKDDMSSGDSKTTPFTMLHLKGLFVEMVVGGTDTTSTLLEFAMAEMVNKPNIMRRAQQEVDAILESSNGPLEESQALQLPFLNAIMKEALRLHPNVPLLIPHTPSKSCIVGGYTVPKGSRIFVNIWAIHRDPSVWEDPLEFKPERFLDETKFDLSGKDCTYFPFGSGRRICPGIAMAERMFMFALASMLHYFDWKLPRGVEKSDLHEKYGVSMKKRTRLLMIPSPRTGNLMKLDSP